MARISPAFQTPDRRSFVQRYLDPTDRLGEVLFGLILVFTLSAGGIVKEGQDAIREQGTPSGVHSKGRE